MSVRTFVSTAACVVALAAAAACTDKVEQPTAPKAAAAVPVAAAVVAAPTLKAANGSTVCLAYMSKRAEAKVRYDKAIDRAKTLAGKKLTETLAEQKARAELKRKFDKTEAMMADACR
jgi:hypothetical protein